MTKIEDLTNEQLNVLVATRVMGWLRSLTDVWLEPNGASRYSVFPRLYNVSPPWSPADNIACAFQVDRSEWRWWAEEENDNTLEVGIFDRGGNGVLANINVNMDPANKAAAYCRGRCIAALKAGGVEEM